ncbi:hypothetical protein JAAARDRAFT_137970 [Jaapia argillacea MUCL 33604]|uniref:Tyr recombinase domain-containing protein n=1 Tax=Jaapia argillacea MUCL 33604 TaxID=933084 RepID=A0A067PDR4_9AGAM|nr:hypothetical protein JAAARDRAFT_137970 [Jaapia argillacea MUCL 33604]
MDPHEVSSPRNLSSSHQSQSRHPSSSLSLTLTPQSNLLRSLYVNSVLRQSPYPNPHAISNTAGNQPSDTKPVGSGRKHSISRANGSAQPRWDVNIVTTPPTHSQTPTPYSSGLTPAVSHLRPHCLARHRLRLWKPLHPRTSLDSQGRPLGLSPADLERIEDVITHAWAESTRELYGSGLLVFHVFCDNKSIPEDQRAPASSLLTSSFVSTIAGAYAGRTISKYLYGVRAWHILHGLEWSLNEPEMEALLKAASTLAPTSSKRKKRQPYTIAFISSLRDHLIPDNPLDAAVYACLTTTFYTAARVGEFTVRRLDAFDPTIHVKPSDKRQDQDRNGLTTTTFHLPRTKSSLDGEDVYWARQDGPTDPEAAWAKHQEVNQPPADGHLFAYRFKEGYRPMTKTKFLERLRAAAREAGLEPLQGHGIRIGSTLEYLLRGLPFDVVKAKGRWASDAFTLYLRKHAQIMAPYMQATPLIHDAFVRYTMPPVR